MNIRSDDAPGGSQPPSRTPLYPSTVSWSLSSFPPYVTLPSPASLPESQPRLGHFRSYSNTGRTDPIPSPNLSLVDGILFESDLWTTHGPGSRR